jgi:hypothetical protein
MRLISRRIFTSPLDGGRSWIDELRLIGRHQMIGFFLRRDRGWFLTDGGLLLIGQPDQSLTPFKYRLLAGVMDTKSVDRYKTAGDYGRERQNFFNIYPVTAAATSESLWTAGTTG